MSEQTSGVVKFRNKSSEQIASTFGETYSNSWGVVYRSNATANSTTHHYNLTAGNVQIWINWNDVLVGKKATCKMHTALHEIGHVIGLKDIPSSVSPNAYLMCNGFGANYSVPSEIKAADIKGAAVILGQHTNHSFATDSSNSERKYCTKCGIYYFD